VGKHNLRVENEKGSVRHTVWDLILHEDWKYNSDDFDADIALVVLEAAVDLNNRQYARVVCLPSTSLELESKIGTIVGWGVSKRSETNGENHDSTPNELQLPVVPAEICYDADIRFHEISSNRTFCAGFVNQNKGTCEGDSGGGFYTYESSSRTYSLSGIVSSGLRNQVGGCRTDIYSVFTDVRKFVGWIEEKIEQTAMIGRYVDFSCFSIR
jgi:secreted trypsin-like serine protease